MAGGKNGDLWGDVASHGVGPPRGSIRNPGMSRTSLWDGRHPLGERKQTLFIHVGSVPGAGGGFGSPRMLALTCSPHPSLWVPNLDLGPRVLTVLSAGAR